MLENREIFWLLLWNGQPVAHCCTAHLLAAKRNNVSPLCSSTLTGATSIKIQICLDLECGESSSAVGMAYLKHKAGGRGQRKTGEY